MSNIKETISISLYLKSFGRLVCPPAGQPIWPFQDSKTISHLACHTASLSVSHTASCLVYLFVYLSIGLCLFLYVSLFVCWVYLSWLLCYSTNFQDRTLHNIQNVYSYCLYLQIMHGLNWINTPKLKLTHIDRRKFSIKLIKWFSL